jgi:hypothetical protein
MGTLHDCCMQDIRDSAGVGTNVTDDRFCQDTINATAILIPTAVSSLFLPLVTEYIEFLAKNSLYD